MTVWTLFGLRAVSLTHALRQEHQHCGWSTALIHVTNRNTAAGVSLKTLSVNDKQWKCHPTKRFFGQLLLMFVDEVCNIVPGRRIASLITVPCVCLRCWDDTDKPLIWWIIKAPITASLLVSVEPRPGWMLTMLMMSLWVDKLLRSYSFLPFCNYFICRRWISSFSSMWSVFWSRSWRLLVSAATIPVTSSEKPKIK